MKFLCDQMLGTLTKWLRIYGFDTYFVNSEMDDTKLIEIAKKENRILITRDRKLIQTARRENIITIEVKTTDINEQIITILGDIKTNRNMFLSRCILCNTKVYKIKKEEAKGKVPERVFNKNQKFWFCKKCNKIYWRGSHYEKMIEKINNLS